MSESNSRTLLAVLAHPDDETFGTGGTLALYAKRGVQVHLICATRGEAGTVSPEFMEGYDSIAALREHELRCAAQHLGLSGVYFLNYRDSGMRGMPENEHPEALVNAPLDELVGQITHFIRELKPQVVVTFDPAGGYGHPDHIATHRATLEAFHASGDPSRYPSELPPHAPQKLYYSTFSRRFLRILLSLSKLLGRDARRWGRNQDIDLVEISQNRFPIHVKIDYRSVAEAKRQATACHASQLDQGSSSRGIMGMLLRLTRRGTVETFMQAHPPRDSGRPERDLFAGVVERAETLSA